MFKCFFNNTPLVSGQLSRWRFCRLSVERSNTCNSAKLYQINKILVAKTFGRFPAFERRGTCIREAQAGHPALWLEPPTRRPRSPQRRPHDRPPHQDRHSQTNQLTDRQPTKKPLFCFFPSPEAQAQHHETIHRSWSSAEGLRFRVEPGPSHAAFSNAQGLVLKCSAVSRTANSVSFLSSSQQSFLIRFLFAARLPFGRFSFGFDHFTGHSEILKSARR